MKRIQMGILLMGGMLVIVGVMILGLGKIGWLDPRGIKKNGDDRTLTRYDFDSLKKRQTSNGFGSQVIDMEFLGKIKEVEERRKKVGYKAGNFKTQQFKFKSEGKWITGMINIPNDVQTSGDSDSAKFPTIIMLRGYADKEGYYSGFGTWKMADKLAENGLVTVSLDFLGFSGSDPESRDVLEARFEKVVNTLDLIEVVKQLKYVNKDKIGIWSHSNGGQIGLSVLEVSGANYPTILWAPMTNPFPQSVLDTASDLDDGGKAVRQTIEEFSRNYDVRRYSIENYYQWIEAPIQIYQGTADEWCKEEWQRSVIDNLENLGKRAELFVYEGDDHNLSKNWEEVASKGVEWYRLMLNL